MSISRRSLFMEIVAANVRAFLTGKSFEEAVRDNLLEDGGPVFEQPDPEYVRALRSVSKDFFKENLFRPYMNN